MSQTVGCEYPISTSSKMYISQSHARWLQRNSPTYILLPRVGMIYPIQTCIYNWYVFPKQLAAHIQYKFVFPSSLNCVHYLYSLYGACMAPVCHTYVPLPKQYIAYISPITPIPDNSQLRQLRCGCKIFQVRGIFSILNATRPPV